MPTLTESLQNDTGRTVLHLYLSLFAVTLAVSLLRRILSGVDPASLQRTRWYEVPPVRGLIHVVHLTAWGLLITTLIAVVMQGVRWSDTKQDQHWQAGLVLLAGGAGLGLLIWFWKRAAVQLGHNRPPAVQVSHVRLTEGIPSADLSRLGQERFPNLLAVNWKQELLLRWLLVLLCLTFLGLTVYGTFFEAARNQWWRTAGLNWMGRTHETLQLPWPVPLPELVREVWEQGRYTWEGLAWFLCGTAGIWLLVTATTNHTYQLQRFTVSLLYQAILASLFLAGISTFSPDPDHLLQAGLMAAILCGGRWAWDLSRSRSYRRRKLLADEIAVGLAAHCPSLPELKQRPDCRLKPLDEGAIAARITQGCRNVEAADWLVTRNFSRYMTLAQVAFEHFVAAMFRFLTVRRDVGETGGGGTSRWLQNPTVPAWDEGLFPLRPPRGFLNWLDPLPLDEGWDRVSLCSCGGSGMMTCNGGCNNGIKERTEYTTEYVNGQSVSTSRTVRETCFTCNGTGKVRCVPCGGQGHLLYRRTLNTHWERFIPAITAPEVPMPELLEDAEERVYYRVPIVENRDFVQLVPAHDGLGTDLQAGLKQRLPALATLMQQHMSSVEKLHGAKYVYRADFQVTGFWTLCIRFRRLSRSLGWFFGRRPEFYFPWLPFSWSMLGTVLFLPPLVLLLAPSFIGWVGSFLSRALP